MFPVLIVFYHSHYESYLEFTCFETFVVMHLNEYAMLLDESLPCQERTLALRLPVSNPEGGHYGNRHQPHSHSGGWVRRVLWCACGARSAAALEDSKAAHA